MPSNETQIGLSPAPTALLDAGRPAYPNLDPHPAAAELAAEPAEPAPATGLDFVLDVPVRLSVELGRAEIPIRDVVNIGRGAIIELEGTPGAPLDVRVNGVLIGRGEIVVINEERLGLRFVEVVSQAERVSRLR
jgi:flagellar motor switch protein FliN